MNVRDLLQFLRGSSSHYLKGGKQLGLPVRSLDHCVLPATSAATHRRAAGAAMVTGTVLTIGRPIVLDPLMLTRATGADGEPTMGRLVFLAVLVAAPLLTLDAKSASPLYGLLHLRSCHLDKKGTNGGTAISNQQGR
jgi:hypothetical protein